MEAGLFCTRTGLQLVIPAEAGIQWWGGMTVHLGQVPEGSRR